MRSPRWTRAPQSIFHGDDERQCYDEPACLFCFVRANWQLIRYVRQVRHIKRLKRQGLTHTAAVHMMVNSETGP